MNDTSGNNWNETNSGWALQIRASIRCCTLTSTTSTGKVSEPSCDRDPVADRSATMRDVPATTRPLRLDRTYTRRWTVRASTAKVLSSLKCLPSGVQHQRSKLKQTLSTSLSTPMIPTSNLIESTRGTCRFPRFSLLWKKKNVCNSLKGSQHLNRKISKSFCHRVKNFVTKTRWIVQKVLESPNRGFFFFLTISMSRVASSRFTWILSHA